MHNDHPDVKIPLEDPFVDDRGTIQPLVGREVHDVALIHSKKGAVRANHYHRTDWHYCYVLSGSIDYYYRPVGSDDEPEHVLIKQGELFYSPPMVEHAMKFPEEATFIVMSGNPRGHEQYESEIVRVRLVE